MPSDPPPSREPPGDVPRGCVVGECGKGIGEVAGRLHQRGAAPVAVPCVRVVRQRVPPPAGHRRSADTDTPHLDASEHILKVRASDAIPLLNPRAALPCTHATRRRAVLDALIDHNL